MLNQSKIWGGGRIIGPSADKPAEERKITLRNLELPTASLYSKVCSLWKA